MDIATEPSTPLGKILKENFAEAEQRKAEAKKAAIATAKEDWLTSEKKTWEKILETLPEKLKITASNGENKFTVLSLDCEQYRDQKNEFTFHRISSAGIILDGAGLMAQEWLASQEITSRIRNDRHGDSDDYYYALEAYW